MSESCGCRIAKWKEPFYVTKDDVTNLYLDIEYCPLHAAASEMLAALKEHRDIVMGLLGRMGSMAHDLTLRRQFLEEQEAKAIALIARAEGKG